MSHCNPHTIFYLADHDKIGNLAYDAINSDLFAAPSTDSGDVSNAVWPMGLSHNRLGLKGAGWARQQNEVVLPAATAMAGVDMRLSPNAYREVCAAQRSLDPNICPMLQVPEYPNSTLAPCLCDYSRLPVLLSSWCPVRDISSSVLFRSYIGLNP